VKREAIETAHEGAETGEPAGIEVKPGGDSQAPRGVQEQLGDWA
jgi:hypothetical protein